MLQTIIKPLPMIFAIAITFGVLVHDTQVDRATTVALAIPAALATFVAVDAFSKANDQHTQVERATINNNLAAIRGYMPRIQPRDDDRRYIQSKKMYVSGGDSISLWPSI